MATATMTAAGAAALLYYTLNRRLQNTSIKDDEENNNGGEVSNRARINSVRIHNRPIQAPATWLETISTLSETLRFTYSETLGKWPIGDLAFGINYLLKRQGNLQVASVYGGNDSVQLTGPEVISELKYLLKLLTLCWHFSKKPFPLFLEETGYSQEDVLLQEPKAGILKPAFTILADKRDKCFYLLIRGTHSIKDTLTAATGAVVPFHHTVVREGGVSDLILGYAHCGMVAAARWIAKLATPCLIKALEENEGFKIKIVGHSLGGGTAALLTYALREQQELSTATCVTFAPAACMTWELAESGKDFIASVVNGSDLVPTFSAASVDDLRSEVTASAWLNDLRNQIEHTRILSTVYRSASALGSRLPSIASARNKVAGAEGILRPVSNGTRVVITRARNVAQAAWARPALNLSSWSCMGVRHRVTTSSSNSTEEGKSVDSASPAETAEPLLTSEESTATTETAEFPVSTPEGTEWTSELSSSDEVAYTNAEADVNNSEDLIDQHEDLMTEVELWQQIEQGLSRQTEAEINDVAEEITEEEKMTIAEVDESTAENLVLEMKEKHRFFPPGKIMHIINFHVEDNEGGIVNLEGKDEEGGLVNSEVTIDSNLAKPKVGIFLTPRSLYSKLRLTQTMIGDHFMPVYRRQMEQLISELEKHESTTIS
ncbi:hypothetical protein AQUCO_02000516v1 [Aquilegia coerulea]|uniref:Fungal lipase-like domain-containing protein n=1 Tax=Aquilegia coerulea TaxID=218851 RepID=A0A2G5DIS8_AQUCA|nr:hypothetical protein AQUCO_02000516v1 [Aquilegia coerulea]